MMKFVNIDTKHGPAQVQVTKQNGDRYQYNCFLPPAGGAGVFAVMGAGLREHECYDTMRSLLESGPHLEDQDLSDLAPHAVAAGSVNMAQSKVPEGYTRPQVNPWNPPPCPSCRPIDPSAPPFSEADYQNALAALAEREDINEEQREMIKGKMAEVKEQIANGMIRVN